jgi:thioredoxin reductase
LLTGGSEWQYPKIPGIETFQGKLMHSARWDQEYDFKDKTVAVIGGGSSSVQIVPELQKGTSTTLLLMLTGTDEISKVAKKLIPFLRSPVWITTGFGAKFAGPQGTNFDCKCCDPHGEGGS